MQFNVKTILLTVLASGCLSIASSTVVFSETFSAGGAHWPMFSTSGTVVDTSTTGQSFNLTSKGTSLGVFRLKTQGMPANIFPDTFSYSITIKSFASTKSRPFVGLGFNVGEDLGGYYFYIDASQTATLSRFQNAHVGYKALAFLPNSGLTTAVNTLTICKRGKLINAYCNSKFVASVTDSAYIPADIALIISDSAKASIDDISVTNTFDATPADTTVLQTFTGPTLSNWYTHITPSRNVYTPGKLTTTNLEPASGVSPTSEYTYANGNFKNASYKAIVKRSGGSNASAEYGISLLVINQTPSMGYQYKTLSFVINSLSQYGIIIPDATSFTLSTSSIIPQPIHGGTFYDTLIVNKIGDRYQFLVNNVVLGETAIPSSFVPNAAGIVVSAGSTVEISYFLAATNLSNGVRSLSHYNQARMINQGILPQAFDIRGRAVSMPKSSHISGVLIKQSNTLSTKRSGLLINLR